MEGAQLAQGAVCLASGSAGCSPAVRRGGCGRGGARRAHQQEQKQERREQRPCRRARGEMTAITPPRPRLAHRVASAACFVQVISFLFLVKTF